MLHHPPLGPAGAPKREVPQENLKYSELAAGFTLRRAATRNVNITDWLWRSVVLLSTSS